MKLIEFSHKAGDWEINNLHLGDVNLIVGENAVGKSRTLSELNLFYHDNYWFMGGLKDGSWKFTFLDEQSLLIEFKFNVKDKNILSEQILYDQDIKLVRDHNTTKIKSSITNEFQEISPPPDKFVFQVRRDIEEYPYFEKISAWIVGLCTFEFSSFRPNNYRRIDYDNNEVLNYFKGLSEANREKIRVNFNQLGYDVEKIALLKFNQDFSLTMGIRGEYYELNIKEKSLKNPIKTSSLSQGMFRSLYLIIFLEYLVDKNDSTTLFVDDFGEGLDYKRAVKLGKFVFELCKDTNIQLIATTNDNFLMDVVDLEHWNILTRKGSKVSAINKTSHPKIFEDFMFTGLSNFDLLTSDYLKRKLKEYDTV